jgi:arylsulfatase
LPKLFNLRTDPYERADVTSNNYYDWFFYRGYFIYVAQTAAAKFAATFKEFPPAQKPGSFTIDDALQKMVEAS